MWSRGSAIVQTKCQNKDEMWSKLLCPWNDCWCQTWVSQKLLISTKVKKMSHKYLIKCSLSVAWGSKVSSLPYFSQPVVLSVCSALCDLWPLSQSVQLQMKAPSGDVIPAQGLGQVTQTVLLNNPNKVCTSPLIPLSLLLSALLSSLVSRSSLEFVLLNNIIIITSAQ